MSISDRAFPGFDQLFAISRVVSPRGFTADVDQGDVSSLDALRGDREVRRATAQWAMGRTEPEGVVWTRDVDTVLFRADVLTALTEANCNGWRGYPVDVRGRDGRNFPGYFGLVIIGRCGPLDPARSVPFMKAFPARESPMLKGLAFDEASWDGSDIFTPAHPMAWKFITRRVRDVIASLTKNVHFRSLAEIELYPQALPARHPV